MTKFRMIYIVITIVLTALAMYTIVRAQQSADETSGLKVRVGTFDSRALAIAYARSEVFQQYINGLMAEYEIAKAAADDKRIKELEAEGGSQQELLQMQSFSTWPVDNILEKIKDEIPEIAKMAEVDVIISKWNIVYKGSGIEFVDVTYLMI